MLKGMRTSPAMKVLLACLGVVLGASVLIGWLAREDGEDLQSAANHSEDLDASATPRQKLRSMVWHREFDRLEKIAAASRKREAAEGEEYVDLGNFDDWVLLSRKHEDHYWEDLLEHLTAWKEAYPDSITPRVALANFWKSYAWKARGGDWAYEVTDEGWDLFEERLLKAQGEWDGVPEENRIDPQFYFIGVQVAMGLSLPKSEALHRFHAGLDVDFHYWPLYSAIVTYFLPRWHGAPGEVGQMIHATVAPMGAHADWALTRFVWALYHWEKEEVFKSHGLDYAPVKEIYEKWTTQSPDVETANYYCLYACMAEDAEAAKRMFDRIGEKFDAQCWGSEENFRKWKNKYSEPASVE